MMKNKFKLSKMLSVMLCIIMMLGVLPTSLFAAKEMFTTYEVKSVTISGIDAPKAGEKFDFTAEENSQKYNIVKVAWKQQYSDNYITNESSTAAEGIIYEVHVILEVATPEHYFVTGEGRVSTVTGTINGKSANVNNSIDRNLYSTDASKYEFDTVYQKYAHVVYSFPAAEATPIESFNINVKIPAPGDRPATKVTIDTVNGKENKGYINVDKVEWKYQIGDPMGDTFEFGESYILQVTLTALYGKKFKVDPTHILSTADNPMPVVNVTINGKSASAFPTYTSKSPEQTIMVSYVFHCNEAKKISEIDISGISAPKSGSLPGYVAVLPMGVKLSGADSGTSKNGITWIESGSSAIPTFGYSFAANTQYIVKVELEAENGYEFDNPKVTFDGKAGAAIDGNKNKLTVTYTFAATGDKVVSSVAVEEIDAPVSGNLPDYTASYNNTSYDAANYNDKTNKNGISWYNETDKKTMSTTDKFEAGKVYTVQIMVWTADGYEFAYKSGAVNVTGTINGKSAEVTSRNKNELVLNYTFPKVEAHKCSPKKIDEVKATCKEEGKKAYYFYPECGKNFEDSKCTKEITDINEWGKIAKLEHTGGKATCDNRAICKNCGEWYGDFAEHKFGTAWDYKDETGHAHKCKECGIIDTIIPHSGGTAKCGETAKCEACKAEYGEVKQHQWSDDYEYTDSTGHAHKCTVCGEHDSVVKHTPGKAATETTSQNCTVCGYMIAPMTTHKHKLVRMDEVDATCISSGMKAYYYCQSCDSIFTNNTGAEEITDNDTLIIPAIGHKDSKWKSDDSVHWKECTAKGCDEITVEKEAHEFNESGKCTVCGYKQGDTANLTEATDMPDDEGTTHSGAADTSDGSSSSNANVNDTEADGDGNTVMWIIIVVCGVAAIVMIAIVASVIAKKKKNEETSR